MPGKLKRKIKNRMPLRFAMIMLVVMASILIAEAVFRIQGSSLIETVLKKDRTRMAAYNDLPSNIYNDLQYLTYIDSLARENRAVPGENVPTDKNLAQIIMENAGVPKTVLIEWGITESLSLTELYQDMYKRGRLLLPREGVSLYQDIKDKRISPGMIIFGQTLPYREDDPISFCGIFSSVNWFQPDYSTVIYSTAGNEILHGPLKGIPDIAYYGCGIPGYNLDEVYTRYIRLGQQKNKKPLY